MYTEDKNLLVAYPHITYLAVARCGKTVLLSIPMNDNTDPMAAFTELADKIRQAAYADGWRDAMNAVSKAVAELAPGEVKDAIGPGTQLKLIGGSAAAAGTAKAKLTMGTTPYFIVASLEAKPGQTPAEIIQSLQDAGHSAPENSIRTNIHRLKERRLIVARHGKWFVV
jgi:hypothetical protein